jgi:hypothetical protein
MKFLIRFPRAEKETLAALLLLGSLSACENIALMPRPTIEAPDAAKNISATVNGIDHNLREIYLRTANNQHYVVNYTAGTQVISRDRQVSPNDLRPGDRIRAEVREGSGRRLFADEIHLEGGGGASAIRVIEGTVERIVLERGFLELRTATGALVTVYVPEGASAETRNRFQRIGVGDTVRLEGERLDEDRLELLAFR